MNLKKQDRENPMDIDRQLRELEKKAPKDGTTPRIMTAISPVLRAFAERLHRTGYYILQSPDRRWQLTTLSNRMNPNLEKRVVYAFPTLEDARAFASQQGEREAIAPLVPTTHILFQAFAFKDTLDSLIFFEEPGNSVRGTEIHQQDLQNSVRSQLQRQFASDRHVPPDIA